MDIARQNSLAMLTVLVVLFNGDREHPPFSTLLEAHDIVDMSTDHAERYAVPSLLDDPSASLSS